MLKSVPVLSILLSARFFPEHYPRIENLNNLYIDRILRVHDQPCVATIHRYPVRNVLRIFMHLWIIRLSTWPSFYARLIPNEEETNAFLYRLRFYYKRNVSFFYLINYFKTRSWVRTFSASMSKITPSDCMKKISWILKSPKTVLKLVFSHVWVIFGIPYWKALVVIDANPRVVWALMPTLYKIEWKTDQYHVAIWNSFS